MIYILAFMAAMMIKGGWLGQIKAWHKLTNKIKDYSEAHTGFKFAVAKVADWILDGTQLSGFVLMAFLAIVLPWWDAVSIGLGWLAVARISMGEEAGGIGNYHENTGDYVEWLGAKDGKRFAFKKGIQYGALFGGMLVFCGAPNLVFVAGLLFPVIYYIGNSIYYNIHRTSSWAYSEPLWGATFGLFFWLGG